MKKKLLREKKKSFEGKFKVEKNTAEKLCNLD
jgi:hypothetical protein